MNHNYAGVIRHEHPDHQHSPAMFIHFARNVSVAAPSLPCLLMRQCSCGSSSSCCTLLTYCTTLSRIDSRIIGGAVIFCFFSHCLACVKVDLFVALLSRIYSEIIVGDLLQLTLLCLCVGSSFCHTVLLVYAFGVSVVVLYLSSSHATVILWK